MKPNSDIILLVFRFLFLLSWNNVILSGQSQTNGARKLYANIYGSADFNSTGPENIIGSAIGGLNFLYNNQLYLAKAQPDVTPVTNSRYDFIVVGAGTAGAAVASRLSEIKEISVLLIEAGPEETLYMDIPIMATFLQTIDDIDWKYETEPSDRYCMGMKNHR